MSIVASLAWVEAIWGLGECLMALGISAAMIPKRSLSLWSQRLLQFILLVAYGKSRAEKVWSSPLQALNCTRRPQCSRELVFAVSAYLCSIYFCSVKTLSKPSIDSLFAAVVEELIFRGVVLRLLLRRCPNAKGGCILTQAFLFGTYVYRPRKKNPLLPSF